MTWDTIRQAIETKIEGAWNKTTFPLARENLPFDTPAGKAWARASIRPATAGHGDVTASFNRVTGFVWFQIFIPAGKGTKPAFDFTEHARFVFENDQVALGGANQIIFRVAEPVYIGVDAASGSDQWRCLVPFEADMT